jgi:hypothetical protein
MGNDVYANDREISCKAAEGKAIAAFPDFCFTPPPTLATPTGVPIPYPNTGFASDATNGSKTVKITGKEVMLRNHSYFKKSTGDEPATRSLPMGVITHTITGKVYFNSWSMDVKFEGLNVVRHFDLTTHNHMSFPGNSPTWPYLDTAALSDADHPCAKDIDREKTACKDYKPHGNKDACKQRKLGKRKPSRKLSSPEANRLADKVAADDCLSARRCSLQPYKPSGCCYPQTPHHLIEASALHETGRGKDGSIPLAGVKDYDEDKAPCVCAEGATQNVGTHGLMHTFQSAAAANAREGDLELSDGRTIREKKTTYGTAKKKASEAVDKTFPESKCDPECIEKQLDNYHKQCGINDRTPIKAVETGQTDVAAAMQAVKERSAYVKATRATGTIV